MTADETNRLIDCVTYEDCTLRLKDSIYWCLGLTYNPKENMFCIQVYEENAKTHNFTRMMLSYGSDSKDDCMKHFLEDKYWDGKSFYEVAPDMEWIDL